MGSCQEQSALYLSHTLHPLPHRVFLLQFSYPMNHIWSPWRMEYIENTTKVDGCIFCMMQEIEDGPENLIAYRGEYSFAILNRYPYTSGHLMVVPFVHKANLEELDAATRAEMMELTTS